MRALFTALLLATSTLSSAACSCDTSIWTDVNTNFNSGPITCGECTVEADWGAGSYSTCRDYCAAQETPGTLECVRAWERDNTHISASSNRCIAKAPDDPPTLTDRQNQPQPAYGTDYGCDYDWRVDGQLVRDSALCECQKTGELFRAHSQCNNTHPTPNKYIQ